MGISNSLSTVTDGLVFYMDAGNKRSWIGPPVTNLLPNKTFSGDWAFTGASYDTPTQRLVTNTSNVAHYTYLNTALVNDVTYTQSVVARAAERSVLQITPSIGLDGYLTNKYVNFDLSSGIMYGTATENCSMVHLGDGWFRCGYRDAAYADGAGRFALGIVASYTAGRLAAYADTANYGIQLKQPQLEASPFASPFIDGSRSNTECILDLTRTSTSTISELTYENDGSFRFDGTNDHFSFQTPTLDSVITIEMMMKVNSLNGMPVGFYGYDIYFVSNALGFNTSASDCYGLTSTQVTNLQLLNNWKHYTFVMKNNTSASVNPYTENKIYINGEAQTLSQVLGTQSGTPKSFSDGLGIVSGWLNNLTQYKTNMSMNNFKIYNRELSQSEILQNFSALRGRYGI